MPPMKPSTMWRALRSRRVILLRTLGSRNLCVASAITNYRCRGLPNPGIRPLRARDLGQRRVLLQGGFLRGNDLEQLVHDLVRRHAFGLGREVGDDPVAQHGM